MRISRHRLRGFGVTAGCSELNAALIPLGVAIQQAQQVGVDPSDVNLQVAKQFYDQYNTSLLGDLFNPLVITSQTQCNGLVSDCNNYLAGLNQSIQATAQAAGQTVQTVNPSGATNPAPPGSGGSLLPAWVPWTAGALVILIGAGIGLGWIKEFRR